MPNDVQRNGRQSRNGKLGRMARSAGLLLALATAGCGDNDPNDTDSSDTDSSDDSGNGGQGGQGGSDGDLTGEHLYAIMYEVYDDTGSNSYLSLVDSLELDSIDPARSREFAGGRAFVQAYGGYFYVGQPVTPTVTRYAVSATGELSEAGDISFANYGFDGAQFDDWNVEFLGPHKAYLMNFADGTTIVWDPTDMVLLGEIEPPPELDREGVSLEGSPATVRDGLLFRTFNWVNYDEAEYSTEFLLAVYDTETDEVLDLVTETRCPVPGNLVDTDEAGNIYFSNWIWPVAGSIMKDAPTPCVLRIKPGETTFDPDWTFDYTEVTDDRKGAMFTYVADGKALISAFYDERTSFDATTDPWGYVGSSNWRIWNVDMETMTGAPLDGIDFNGGAFTPIQADGRLLLMVPGGADESYATQLYEVKGNVAEPRVKLPGWSYQFEQLR